MPSTFFGLNTAYLGLSAANASLNTTSNNIANRETEGYSRQYTVQQASDALRTFTTYGCAGAGVDVLSIERYRDEFYDVKYWRNNSNTGEYTTKQYYMKQIEDYFRDDGDEEDGLEGFSTIFDNMYDALADVKKDSGTNETRRTFLGRAEELAEYFNTMSGNLQKMQKDVNAEIKINVDQINSLTQEIVTLNKQINVIELSGSKANELRDRRALLIDELSEIVNVETEEQLVTDPHNPDRYTGATRFIVKIAGGQTLLDDQNYYTLNCIARGTDEKVNQNDADGMYDIVWSNGNQFSLKNASLGGKLKALAELRDGNNGEYFHGTISATDIRKVDGVSHSIVTVDVTADYLKDINKCTLPESGKITLGNRELYFDSWTMNYNASTNSYSYEFVLSDTTKNEDTGVGGLIGKEAAVGDKIEYQGIPYYMEQMNEWIRCYSKTFNDIMTQDGAVDNYGNAAQFLFKANMATDDDQWEFDDSYNTAADGSYSISSKDDSYYRLTALNFAISEEMLDDPNLMAVHTGNQDEMSKYNVVDDLIDLKTNVEKMKFRGSSSSQFLQCILADISLNAQRANDFSENYENIGKSIQTQRLSVSGVDEDEEALNLVKYQNAYTLASKMIQTLTEVYDRLILETGV
ncbi:MAG: flagellar hook-associated protein FlgK [Lachnospiraceae bacterium]|nr:flagellar hook-associated protein FlgK [Lachnospiraceae bacterium]